MLQKYTFQGPHINYDDLAKAAVSFKMPREFGARPSFTIENATFEYVEFLDICLRDCVFRNCVFDGCAFVDCSFSENTEFIDCRMVNCQVEWTRHFSQPCAAPKGLGIPVIPAPYTKILEAVGPNGENLNMSIWFDTDYGEGCIAGHLCEYVLKNHPEHKDFMASFPDDDGSRAALILRASSPLPLPDFYRLSGSEALAMLRENARFERECLGKSDG